jgi:hypothetical protein
MDNFGKAGGHPRGLTSQKESEVIQDALGTNQASLARPASSKYRASQAAGYMEGESEWLGTISMSIHIIFIIAIILALIPFGSHLAHSAEYVTPLGIRIRASQSTIDQYNRHWYTPDPNVLVYPFRPHGVWEHNVGPEWDGIRWERIDQFYRLLRDKHGGVPHSDPTTLKVVIRLLNYKCLDEDPNSYEMTGCIDGYFPTDNTLWIHLGDDSGQGDRAFCGTALEHELNHYFLRWKGSSYWASEYSAYYFGVEELCQ